MEGKRTGVGVTTDFGRASPQDGSTRGTWEALPAAAGPGEQARTQKAAQQAPLLCAVQSSFLSSNGAKGENRAQRRPQSEGMGAAAKVFGGVWAHPITSLAVPATKMKKLTG